MRIALVGPTYPFRGGIAQYTTLLCRALRERHEVGFFSLKRQYPSLLFPGKSQTDASEMTIRVDAEPSLDSINPFSWLGTVRRIRRFRPELILFSWWHPFFAPAFGTVSHLSRWFGGFPSAFLCHNVIPHERSIVDRLLLRYAFASARSFITHSQQDRDDLLGLRPGADVCKNPHPTYDVFDSGTTVSTDEAKASLGLGGKRVLLFFGFVRPYKGLSYLLEATEMLAADERYHLLIVGEFYESADRYQPRLDRLKASGRVTLVDRYVANEEVPLYFSAADLLMVPYLSATQSGVIQIAYGFEKPVVATRVGGIPEVVTEGQTGYLVPPGDAAAMAQAVRTYFAEERVEQFRQGIARESHRFSWERMVEAIEQLARKSAGV